MSAALTNILIGIAGPFGGIGLCTLGYVIFF